MAAWQFRFGAFRLLPTARELWRDDVLVRVPRHGFDCLLYLIEHRDRAVGRDELAAAVWGRVDVTDSQVNQAILRARLAVGDDGQSQHVIRTASGFGYRWVAAVDALDEPTPAGLATDSAAPSTASAEAAQAMPAPAPIDRSRWRLAAPIALAALLAIAAASAIWHAARRPAPAAADTPASAVLAVLPFDVETAGDDGWLRLGAMDAVTENLQRGGVAVAPSDSVIAALNAAGTSIDDAGLDRLKRLLGATQLVRGAATHSVQGWTIELETTAANGESHRETATRPAPIEAAQRAAGLLAAAFGHDAPNRLDEHGDLDEILKRSRAALLANELDAARAILAQAPEPLRDSADVRAAAARIDFRQGQLEQATTVLSALLGDSAVVASPALHAQVETTLGFIAIRQEDCAVAEARFAAALSALAGDGTREYGIALSARGLARACLRRFDEAAADLSAAGTQLEAGGDRLARARVDNYFGILETYRDRPAAAVPYFLAAAALDEAFGVVDSTRANLTALCAAQVELLRWSDALASGDRLRALRARTKDPALLFASAGLRARALLGLGRFHDAETELDATEAAYSDAHGVVTRYLYAAKAELAWARRQPEAAIVQIEKALRLAPPLTQQAADDDHARAVLLLQRASILAGHGIAAQIPEAVAAPGASSAAPLSPIYRIAGAEWAAHAGDSARAERDYRDALADAEEQGVPATIVLVADSYADWALAHDRLDEAKALAGRVAAWADGDFESALLQVRIFHATVQTEAWRRALRQAQGLAGERSLPQALLRAP